MHAHVTGTLLEEALCCSIPVLWRTSSRATSDTIGQAPSSRTLQQAISHPSGTAGRAAADEKHHAVAEHQWRSELDAKRQALGSKVSTLIMVEGMQILPYPLM